MTGKAEGGRRTMSYPSEVGTATFGREMPSAPPWPEAPPVSIYKVSRGLLAYRGLNSFGGPFSGFSRYLLASITH